MSAKSQSKFQEEISKRCSQNKHRFKKFSSISNLHIDSKIDNNDMDSQPVRLFNVMEKVHGANMCIILFEEKGENEENEENEKVCMLFCRRSGIIGKTFLGFDFYPVHEELHNYLQHIYYKMKQQCFKEPEIDSEIESESESKRAFHVRIWGEFCGGAWRNDKSETNNINDKKHDISVVTFKVKEDREDCKQYMSKHHNNVSYQKNAKRVQPGMLVYHPKNKFLVFDLSWDYAGSMEKTNYITKEFYETCYQDWKTNFKTFNAFLHYLPILHSGSLQSCIEYSKKTFDKQTTVCDLLEISCNFSNIREGNVIKSNDQKRGNSVKSRRYIRKHKNKSYTERSKCKASNSTDTDMKTIIDQVRNELQTYVTENRVNNVISHGDLFEVDEEKLCGVDNERYNKKLHSKLAGLCVQDVFAEVEKENESLLNQINCKTLTRKHVKKIKNILSQQFIKIILKSRIS